MTLKGTIGRVWRVYGTLAVGIALTSTVARGATLDGATLSGNTLFPTETTTTIFNNLTLDNADVEVRGQLEFLGTNTLDGTGRLALLESGNIRYSNSGSGGPAPGHSLTIGSGVEVVGSRDGGPRSPSIRFGSSSSQDQGRLINLGILAAEGNPTDLNTDLSVSPLLFENRGLVTARSGGRMRLFMREGSQNLGTFRAEDGGTFNLAGTIDPSQLGTLEVQGTGLFTLDATIENAGKTFTLDTSTGSMQLEGNQNKINGGRVVGLDGAKLFSLSFARRLRLLELNDGVVLDIDMDIRGSSANVAVRGGLTVNGTFFFDGRELTFFGDGPPGSTLNGTGLLHLNDGLHFSDPLTIAAGMTVRGGLLAPDIDSLTGDTLVNLGSLEAIGSDWLRVVSGLSQQGQIRAGNGGKITLEGSTDNMGSILAATGGSVRFDAGTQRGRVVAIDGGTFQFFGGTNAATGVVLATDGGIVQISTPLQNDGVIEVDGGFLWLSSGDLISGNDAVVNDSTVVLSNTWNSTALPNVTSTNTGWGLKFGTLNNTGNTLTLTADHNTQWTLFEDSTVVGGTIASPDDTPLRLGTLVDTTASVTLDAVQVLTQTVIGAGHTLTAINGTALPGGVLFNGGGLLVVDQPGTLADLPVMTGLGGGLRLLDELDLNGTTWVLPTALDIIELERFRPGENIAAQPKLINGRIEGAPTQQLTVLGRFAGPPTVLRDLTLAIDLDLFNFYALAQVEGDVLLDGATVHVMSTAGKDTVSSLFRHGELRVGTGGRLLGQGQILFESFLSTGFGGFTTLEDELVITGGIKVIGGDGRGLIGTDTGITRNQGTLRAESRDDGLSSLLIVGDGLDHQGTLEVEAGGWVEVKATATLGGELVLDYTDASGLAEGDLFPVLSAATRIGGFDLMTTNLSAELVDSGLGVALIYSATAATARISRIGDLNGDGFVGIGDLNIVIAAWNQNVDAGVWQQGDSTGDGFIGIADLSAVLAKWNTGALPPAGVLASVPEPSSGVLLLVSLVGTCGRRRRR